MVLDWTSLSMITCCIESGWYYVLFFFWSVDSVLQQKATRLNSRPPQLFWIWWVMRTTRWTSTRKWWDGERRNTFTHTHFNQTQINQPINSFCPNLSRDRKRKRFVRDTGKEDKKNKIKTECGQVVSAKKSKKSLYPFIWQLFWILNEFWMNGLMNELFGVRVFFFFLLHSWPVMRNGRRNTRWTMGMIQMERTEGDGDRNLEVWIRQNRKKVSDHERNCFISYKRNAGLVT